MTWEKCIENHAKMWSETFCKCLKTLELNRPENFKINRRSACFEINSLIEKFGNYEKLTINDR